jgi:dihydrofolate reductase
MGHAQPLAMIVAASENGLIGRDGDLPWRLSADLKQFKKLTMGHHMIMGRKTFESIGVLLPGRHTVIVTRQMDFQFEGATVVHSIDDAVQHARGQGDQLPFVVGGAEIYRLALPLVTDLFLTRVHTNIDGDTFLPEIDWSTWDAVESRRFDADDRNQFDYSFERWVRK